MRGVALALACTFLGCAGYTKDSGGLWSAALAAGLAATTSLPALLASPGDCLASCPPEYWCDRSTGSCERRPCGGHCTSSQSCITTGALETCTERTIDAAPPEGSRSFHSLPMPELLRSAD